METTAQLIERIMGRADVSHVDINKIVISWQKSDTLNQKNRKSEKNKKKEDCRSPEVSQC
jgi:hypothetical protein